MKYTAISALVVGLLTVARSQEQRNDNQLTDLAVVQGSSLATPIALSAESFTDLITNGNIFIDKSLIIKRILDREIGHMKLLSRPPGWGKTMVLDMIRKFFAVEFDANGDHVLPDEQTHGYKLFELGEYKGKGPMRKLERPLLISKHKDIMRNHRGHYPVLYTSFSGFKPKNFEEYETGVALRFRDAFHKYNFNQMVETLRSIGRAPDNEALQRLRNVTELKEKFEWKDLRTMCDLLERYFKRKPLILIDDYDDPLVEALADHTIDQRRELVKAITKSYVWLFLELKEGDFYTHAMLTCITRVMYENYTQSGDVCGVQDPTFARFHGFHSNEIDMIFRHLNIPEDLRNKTHAYYGGYQLGRYDQKHYTPSSIAKFVATRKFQPYWKMREAVDKIFDKCVQNHFFRHLIHRPISGDAKYKIPLIDHDFDFDSVKFARFLDNPEMSFPYGWSDVCLGYGAGYLTNGVEYDPELSEPYFYEEIVPNEEVRKEIERKLKIYYANELGVSNRDFKEVEALTRKYERFLYSNLNNSIDMCEAFENFLHKLPALNPLSNAPFTIDHIERRTFHSKLAHSLLNFMLLFLPGFELLDSNYCDDQTDARAFLTMSRGTFGVVQRFTFGYDSPDYAFRLTNKLPSRLAPFSFPHLQLVRRVGINYGPMTKVEIIALTSNITGEYEKIVKKDEDKDESVHVLRTIMESDSAQTEDYGTVIYNATDSEGMIWNHTMRYWMGNTFDFSKEMDECYHSNESVSL